MKSSLLNFLAALATFCTLTNAYKLSFYSGKSCRSQGLGSREIAPDTGCGRDFAGVGASAVVSVAEKNKDYGKIAVFFSGDDCKPSDIMDEGDAFRYEDGCWTGNYGSYEVWDLWDVEGMDPEATE
jgi:hypothetical protein